jgi:hypothetical protein
MPLWLVTTVSSVGSVASTQSGRRVPMRSSTSWTPMLEHSSSASPTSTTLRLSVPCRSTCASAATAAAMPALVSHEPRPYSRPASTRGSNGSISMPSTGTVSRCDAIITVSRAPRTVASAMTLRRSPLPISSASSPRARSCSRRCVA